MLGFELSHQRTSNYYPKSPKFAVCNIQFEKKKHNYFSDCLEDKFRLYVPGDGEVDVFGPVKLFVVGTNCGVCGVFSEAL